ncbi:MAG TPA: cation:proton antiporter, partial [Nitrospira sp.]|nr:cation:proton antiporter [Nitrospira sp.]
MTEVVFAILIVEDLIAILLLAGLPAFTQAPDASGWVIAKAAGTLFMFLITLLAGGLVLIPRVLRMVMRRNRPEMTLVVSIGICFAVSLLAKEMGYSVALGAFLAGSLMAESGEEGYLDTLVRPVRDMFAAIFFVSVGMLIDPAVIGSHWLSVLLFTFLVIVGKFFGVVIGAFLAGYGTCLSIRSGMSLAQIGEFSFIIAGVGVSTGATRDFLYPLAVAVSAITTLTTPWLIRSSDPVAKWVDLHMPRPLQTFTTLYGTWIERLRQTHPLSRKSRIKKVFLLLLMDIALLVGLVIAASLSIDGLVARMKSWFNLPETWAHSIGILATLILALPFCIGIIRCIRALGFDLAA